MSSDLAPYATHPDLPHFHGMVADSAAELAAVGAKARRLDIRLSFHPSQFVVLNSPDPELVRKSAWDLASQAEMLDRMELGPEAVMVIHVGGQYGDRVTSRERWARVWPTLPEPVRRRLVLEHDDIRFSAADVLWVHEQTGVRLIIENYAQIVERRDRKTGKLKTVAVAPVWTGHADFASPFEFAAFMRATDGLEFDVMLESKAKDVALIRLRPDLLRYASDVAARFGLTPEHQATFEEEEAEVVTEEAA